MTSSPSSQPTPTLLGLGYPLIDLILKLAPSHSSSSDDLLSRFHLQPNNAVLASDFHSTLYRELLENKHGKTEFIAGGATLNTLRVAKWLLRERGRTVFIGRVGTDEFADILRRRLEDDGVEGLLQTPSEGDGESLKESGSSAVLVTPEGERSLVTFLGASRYLTLDYFNSHLVQSALQRARIVYACGFMCQDSAPEHYQITLSAARFCSERGIDFALNLSAPYICRDFSDRILELLPYTRYLFGNESEALALASACSWPEAGLEFETIANRIREFSLSGPNERTVVITLDTNGALHCSNSGCQIIAPDQVPESEVIDTTGAGDSFVGGFLAAILAGQGEIDATRVGNWAAGRVIRRLGVRFERDEKCPVWKATNE